jgi:hypothetical protein
MAYLVDFIVYGNLYKLVGFSTTFTEINFFPDNLLCYKFNWFQEGFGYSSVPTLLTGGGKEPNTWLALNAP